MNDNNYHFAKFHIETIPAEYQKSSIVIYDLLAEDGSHVEENQKILEVMIDNRITANVSALISGKIKFYKFPGQSIMDGEYLCRIDT